MCFSETTKKEFFIGKSLVGDVIDGLVNSGRALIVVTKGINLENIEGNIIVLFRYSTCQE